MWLRGGLRVAHFAFKMPTTITFNTQGVMIHLYNKSRVMCSIGTSLIGCHNQPRSCRPTVGNVIPVRTIVINEKLIEQGNIDKFGSGFSKDGGLDKFGSFPEMDAYMVDYVPDLTVNVVPVLQELSLTNAWPTSLIGHTFNNVHVLTGLPWFATISAVAIVIKLASYPLHIWWRRECQDHVKTLPMQMTTFLHSYFSGVIKHGPEDSLKQALAARADYCNKVNLPPFPSLFPIYATTLIPLVMAIGLASLTNLTFEPLLSGGALWFPNLSEPDPYCVLPLLNSLLIIANTRFHPSGFLVSNPVFIIGFKFQLPLGILTVSQLWFSSSLLVYWISANSVGLVIQLLLRLQSVRQIHGLETKIEVFRPLLKESAQFEELGNQIESAKTQYLERKLEEQKLISDLDGANNKLSSR